MNIKPVFEKILQIGKVVNNLDQSMKKYWEEYGIGPWDIYTFDSSTVSDMIIRDKKVDYAMRVATAFIGDVQWELIEPLDDKSIYAEFLNEQDEGIHHTAFHVDKYDDVLAHFKKKGIGILQSGTWNGLTYTYLDLRETMSIIAEIYRVPEGWTPPEPEATYP